MRWCFAAVEQSLQNDRFHRYNPRMRNRGFSSSRLKGGKVSLAPTDQVERFQRLIIDFMTEIFDLYPGDYLVTDESDLLDFVSLETRDTSVVWRGIKETYGIAFADVGSERLVKIVAAIAQAPRLQ
jgi:hypothetical protein